MGNKLMASDGGDLRPLFLYRYLARFGFGQFLEGDWWGKLGLPLASVSGVSFNLGRLEGQKRPLPASPKHGGGATFPFI